MACSAWASAWPRSPRLAPRPMATQCPGSVIPAHGAITTALGLAATAAALLGRWPFLTLPLGQGGGRCVGLLRFASAGVLARRAGLGHAVHLGLGAALAGAPLVAGLGDPGVAARAVGALGLLPPAGQA